MRLDKPSPSIFKFQYSLLFRNTFFNLFGSTLYLLAGLFAIPVIIRYLGVERFGVFSLTWAILGYFTLFDLGLGRATTKFVAEALGKNEAEKVPSILWNAVIFQGLLGFLGTAVLISLTPLLVERILNIPSAYINEAKDIFYLVAFSIPAVLISSSFRGVLEAEQRFGLINIVNMPFGIGNFILPLLGIFLGFGLKGIVMLLFISKVILLFVWIALCSRFLFMLKGEFFLNKKVIRSLFTFGGWVTISSLAIPILLYLDRFLIGTFSDISSVTYYTAPYEVVARLWAVPGSLSVILFPAFSSLTGKKANGEIEILFCRSLKSLIIMIGFMVILSIFFAKGLMGLWLGGDFAQNSSVVFQILLIGFFMVSLASVPYNLIYGFGRPDIIAKFNVIEFIIYVPLVLYLIKKWGIKGAAVACTLRIAVDMCFLFLASRKLEKIGISNLSERGGLARAAIVLLAFALGVYLVRGFYWRYYGLFVLIIIFFLINWLYVLNRNERCWLINKIRQIIARKFAL